MNVAKIWDIRIKLKKYCGKIFKLFYGFNCSFLTKEEKMWIATCPMRMCLYEGMGNSFIVKEMSEETFYERLAKYQKGVK